MNILIVSTVSYSLNGIANVIKNLYRNDKFSNKKISFLFPDNNNKEMIHDLENYGYKVYQFARYQKGIIQYYHYLENLIKKEKFDIVHIHGNSHAMIVELLAATVGGCKIRICHSHNTTCNNVLLHKLLKPVFDMLCTDRMACGKQAGEWMYGKKQFTIVHNGIITERFKYRPEKRDYIRKKYNISSDELLLGNVGGLNEQKNQTVLLDIVKKISIQRKCKCMIIGTGEKQQELEEKVRKLNIDENVIFCGGVSNVEEYLNAIDIIVMPSLYEGLPLALIEEQANGLTCVISGVITKEADKSGNIIYIKDINNINEWIKKILEIPFQIDREYKSKNAISQIIKSGYSIDEEIQNLYNYYIQIIHNRR